MSAIRQPNYHYTNQTLKSFLCKVAYVQKLLYTASSNLEYNISKSTTSYLRENGFPKQAFSVLELYIMHSDRLDNIKGQAKKQLHIAQDLIKDLQNNFHHNVRADNSFPTNAYNEILTLQESAEAFAIEIEKHSNSMMPNINSEFLMSGEYNSFAAEIFGTYAILNAEHAATLGFIVD